MAKDKPTGTSLEQFEQSLQQRKFSPLYLFHGDEDFLVEQAQHNLIGAALDESTKGFNLDIVYGGNVSAQEIIALASAFPMMGERRVVVVREFERLSNKDPLLPYVENPLLSTSLLLVSARPDFRLKVFKSLQDHATVVEFKQLRESDIPGWIRRRVDSLGKQITSEACQVIQSHVSRSLREVQNEIDKLFLFVGEKKTIDADDVNSVVGMSKQYNIFELQRAIGRKDTARALEVMDRMIDVGESPIGMIVMLTRYFQKIWLLQELKQQAASQFKLANSVGVSTVFISEYLDASKRFSSTDLEQCFSALLETDLALKSANRDPKLTMTLLLYALTKPERRLEPA